MFQGSPLPSIHPFTLCLQTGLQVSLQAFHQIPTIQLVHNNANKAPRDFKKKNQGDNQNEHFDKSQGHHLKFSLVFGQQSGCSSENLSPLVVILFFAKARYAR